LSETQPVLLNQKSGQTAPFGTSQRFDEISS
jgi:hypothetical protein